jgi:formylglycine-generating enzyme required for sulfatase activity/dienelactone hydrolase
MGEVYRALDTRLSRTVAVKVVSPQLASQKQFLERFDREAATISQLNHPNICTVHDVGHQDGVDFLVMEFVTGRSLAERLASERLSLAESVDIALQMARGLAHAHRLGIVHRDVKPANVMFTDDGLVKIVDFGVARSKRDATAITQTGLAVGTLAYMAPEQFLQDGKVSPASDVWSLGVVLYEMVTGARPFKGADAGSLLRSILHDAPPAIALEGASSGALRKIIKRAVEKDPEDRPTAAELIDELSQFRATLSTSAHAVVQPVRRSGWWMAAVAMVLVLAAVLALREVLQTRRERWAREQALPEIERLLAADEYVAAFALVQQAEDALGDDPQLTRLWPVVSVPASIVTDPVGATVYAKAYDDPSDNWQELGTTPNKTRLPRGALRFRLEKAGFQTVHLARTLTVPFEPGSIRMRVATARAGAAGGAGEAGGEAEGAGGAGEDTVDVPGDTLPVNLSGFNTESLITLSTFAIDRTEVTHRAFKEFAAAGGYDDPAYWQAGRGRPELFVDGTGRRGPATWEAGDVPAGRAEEPVGGVSWYEAAAYCAFRGAQLPTVYHWARAALAPREVTAPLGPSIVPLSNFSAQGPAPVGTYQGMGPYGTVDMAGNIREWTVNPSAAGDRRLILGGAWNDPDYMFSVPFSLPPEDRSATNGFRCMRDGSGSAQPLDARLVGPVDIASSDYRDARPVSREVYEVFTRQYAYEPGASSARVEGRETTPAGSIREEVTLDVGYNGERMRVYVFLPPDESAGKPPYQAVIYFPALNAFQAKRDSHSFFPGDYVVKSGRVMVVPIFKGSFERWDSTFGLTGEEYLRALRLRLAEWRQDLGRTIDYLSTRPDIDAGKIGYYGRSFGASMPLPLLALEPRLKLAMFYSGGFTYRRLPAETDAVNYAPHITIPVLMLNGRHDYVLPAETSQRPLFNLLGTPPADKRHVIYDAGHDPLPRSQFIREILAWLDRYFGPPR